MAKPTVFKYGAGLVYLGDGASPEVFSKLCGFKSIGFAIEKDTGDTTVVDCDDPDAASWKDTAVTAMGWTAEFSGELAKEAESLLWAAVNKTTAVSLRIRIVGAGTGPATPDLQFAGAGHITYAPSGAFGALWQVSVSVTGDGALTRSSVAALA